MPNIKFITKSFLAVAFLMQIYSASALSVAPPASVTSNAYTSRSVNFRHEIYTGYTITSWTPVLGATGYVVKRIEQNSSPSVLTSLSASSTNYADTNVKLGGSYRYSVQAVIGSDVSSFTDGLFVTVPR